MAGFDNYTNTPVGSLLTRTEKEETQYIDELQNLPKSVTQLLMSAKTGSYLAGLAKTYDIEDSLVPTIAFLVLQIATGKRKLSQLPSSLSSQLQISNELANSIAKEIEQELFAPISVELNQYLREKKANEGSMSKRVGDSAEESKKRNSKPSNVVDLKRSGQKNEESSGSRPE